MGQVGNLVVDGEVLALVVDDEDTDGAGATAESLLELVEEVALVDDLETLLDLTGLGHGDELAVITDVNETVLLEDGAEERVENDRGRGVRDDARLLMELLGEEVHTEVTVLAGLRRGGDADNLARALLEDDEITNADVVAGDGEGVLGSLVSRRDEGGLLGRRLLDGRLRLVVAELGLGAGGVVVVLAHFDGLEGFAVDGRSLVNGLFFPVDDGLNDLDVFSYVLDLLRLLLDVLDDLLRLLGLLLLLLDDDGNDGSFAGAVGRRGRRRAGGRRRRRRGRLGVNLVLDRLGCGRVVQRSLLRLVALGLFVLVVDLARVGVELVVNFVLSVLLYVVQSLTRVAQVNVVVLLLMLHCDGRGVLGRL